MRHKILKKHLKEGNVLPIYLDWQKQQRFRGNAVLIKRLQEREPAHEEKVYEFAEVGDNRPDRVQDKIQILYNYQWWLIKFTDGNEKGFQTAVKIAYYQRTFWLQKDE